MGDILGVSLLLQFLTELLIDQMVDTLNGLTLPLSWLWRILLLFEPLRPFFLLLAMIRDPINEGAQIFALECQNGSLGEDWTAAHVDETGVLWVVLHLNMI